MDGKGGAPEGATALEESMARAHEALKRMWERERPAVPQRRMRFTVTLHCTFDEFESVKLALKGFCPGRKWFRQDEIPESRGEEGGSDGGRED